jgi:uracil phosphoribosyltransferase
MSTPAAEPESLERLQAKAKMAAAGGSPARENSREQSDPAALAASMMREYPNLTVIRVTAQVQLMHTQIRNRETTMTDFIFYADRLIRIIVEEGLSFLPTARKDVITPTQDRYEGVCSAAGICGVSIMRAGESMEQALRDTCRGVKIGKILIQRNEATKDKEPDERYNYAKLPQDIADRWVLLLDPMLATGGSACKAIKCLVEKFRVREERIVFLNVVSCPEGIKRLSTDYPRVRIVTSAVDYALNEHRYILPGLGDFGDRYFGT